MITSTIRAVYNIIKYDTELEILETEGRRDDTYGIGINNIGAVAEEFAKDSLCDSFNDIKERKDELYKKYLSYTGSQNNPPDSIIRGGDVYEIKKYEGDPNIIHFNSSYPKAVLYKTDPMITKECRECELEWIEKDICYVFCNMGDKYFKNIWFIDGYCFAADMNIYEGLKETLRAATNNSGMGVSKTNEIGRVNSVDLLGITNCRIRGMWEVYTPPKIFQYLKLDNSYGYLRLIMLQDKFYTQIESTIDKIEYEYLKDKCKITEVKIKDPNNIELMLDAVVVEYKLQNIIIRENNNNAKNKKSKKKPTLY